LVIVAINRVSSPTWSYRLSWRLSPRVETRPHPVPLFRGVEASYISFIQQSEPGPLRGGVEASYILFIQQSEEIFTVVAPCRFRYPAQRSPYQRSERGGILKNMAKVYAAERMTIMMGDPPVCGLQHSTTAFRKAPSSAPPGVCRRLIGIF